MLVIKKSKKRIQTYKLYLFEERVIFFTRHFSILSTFHRNLDMRLLSTKYKFPPNVYLMATKLIWKFDIYYFKNLGNDPQGRCDPQLLCVTLRPIKSPKQWELLHLKGHSEVTMQNSLAGIYVLLMIRGRTVRALS